MTTSVTLVIPTYQRGPYLVDTARQALAQDPPADEIIVVDQTLEHAPEVEAFLGAETEAGRIRHLRQQPPDLQKARNRGLLEARCDVVLFIDDDVVLPSGFVAAHRRNYDEPTIAAVAGRVVSPLTPADAAQRPLHRPGGARFDFLHFRLDGAQRVEGVANWLAGNASARREVLLGVGGFDETYVGYGWEDVDAAIRLWKAGHRVVYDPQAWLEHLMAPSGGQGLRSQESDLFGRLLGAHYFYWHHLFPHWRYATQLPLFFRRQVLTRRYLQRPWVIPGAALAFFQAWLSAVKSAPRLLMDRGPEESPQSGPGDEYRSSPGSGSSAGPATPLR